MRAATLRLFAAAAAAFVAVAGAPLCAGAGDPPPVDDAVVVHAAVMERRPGEDVVVAEGSVDISRGELRLRADRVVLNEESLDVVATGHVILDDGASRLQGEYLEFNIDTQLGFVTDGQGFAEDYFFTGERIEKVGDDRYLVKRGSFTTCEGVLPDWKFRSPEATIHVNHYLRSWHPSMWVKRVPVLYLPYVVFPVKKDRATGFLVPKFRYNRAEGFITENAFFWAPRDNFDATVKFDYRERTGWGEGLEIRYITEPGTHGQLEAYYLRTRSTGEESWEVDFSHQHALPYGVKGQAEAFVQSDRFFVRRIAQEIEKRSQEKATSSFYLSRSWDAFDVVLSGSYEESLVTEKRTSITRLPEITLDTTSNRLLGTDLFWRFSVEGANLASRDDEDEKRTSRVDAAPEISWPVALGSWGSITPFFGYHETWYSRGLDGEEVVRGIPQYRLSLEGPRLYRIFDTGRGIGHVEKFKHLVEPEVIYLYVPEKDQENIPQFDAVDFIAPANQIKYSLVHTLLGKITQRRPGAKAPTGKGGPATDPVAGAPVTGNAAPAEEAAEEPPETFSRTKEYLRVKFSQTYDLDPAEIEGTKRPFSPMQWEITSRPSRRWDLRWKGDWDFDERHVGFQNLSLTWRPSDAATLKGEWRMTDQGTQDYLDLKADLALEAWGLEGRSRYRIRDDEFVENRIAVLYKAQCWDVRTEYLRWPDDYEFRLEVSLKGIGTVISY